MPGAVREVHGYRLIMGIERIVPNLRVTDVDRSTELYAQVFDLDVGMKLDWIGNLGPAAVPAVQLQVLTQDASASCNPDISVGVTTAADDPTS